MFFFHFAVRASAIGFLMFFSWHIGTCHVSIKEQHHNMHELVSTLRFHVKSAGLNMLYKLIIQKWEVRSCKIVCKHYIDDIQRDCKSHAPATNPVCEGCDKAQLISVSVYLQWGYFFRDGLTVIQCLQTSYPMSKKRSECFPESSLHYINRQCVCSLIINH